MHWEQEWDLNSDPEISVTSQHSYSRPSFDQFLVLIIYWTTESYFNWPSIINSDLQNIYQVRWNILCMLND